MNPKTLGKYYALGQCGLEMVAPMILGIFIDKWLNTSPVFISICAVIGFVGGLYHIIVLSKQIDEEEKNAKKKT